MLWWPQQDLLRTKDWIPRVGRVTNFKMKLRSNEVQLLSQESSDQQTQQQSQHYHHQLTQSNHKVQQLEIENKSHQENIRQQQKDLLHL